MDALAFSRAVCTVLGGREEEGPARIGTLSEKTMHAAVKQYLDPDPAHQEVRTEAGLIADVWREDGIYEVQTRSFNRLPRKLDALLPLAPVTVVYPLPHRKYLRWIDTQTGEITPRRRSNKQGSFMDAIPELYWVRSHLTRPGVRVLLLLVDVEEYRYLDGWGRGGKRGSTRCERMPLELVDERLLSTPADYRFLLPEGLPTPFTVADYRTAARLSATRAARGMYLLRALGLVERVGKRGNSYLYRVTE